MRAQPAPQRLFAWILRWPGFFVLTLLILTLAPCMGMERVWPWSGGLDGQVFWQIRLPRVLAGYLCGAGLAMGGLAFQAMFRSPLATPYTLGVASGASFGSVLMILLQGWIGMGGPFLGLWPPTLAALLGAALTMTLIDRLADIRRHFSMGTLLLAGIAFNYFFGSAVAFIQYISDFTNVFRILHSLMGGLEGVGYPELSQLGFFVLPGLGLLIALPDEFNLLQLGEELAVSRGLALKRTYRQIFAGTSLIVGGVVAICGPIGFIGMMAPHIARLLVGGGEHRRLLPVTLLLGGSLLTVCDTLARTLIAPAEIPVGVITALLGCPFFLWLLLKNRTPVSL